MSFREGNTIYRLPRSHWHCGLNNFDWPSIRPQSTRTCIVNFLAAAEKGEAPHLLLTGSPGVGKSHIGVGVYRSLAAVFGTVHCTWVNVPNYCEEVKRSYNPEEVSPWYDYEEARRLVVLDDLFGRDLTQHEVSHVVYRLIDTAYQNGAAVLLTMNQSVQDLQARLHSHEVSRVLAGATIIPVTADKDRRRV